VNLQQHVQTLYRTFGPPKQMGQSPELRTRPHFFLHRNFLGEQDLAILFSTKRCRYQCKFCALPLKSSRAFIEQDDVMTQYAYVIDEVKHSLGVLDRLTVANEGSVFDESTFPPAALDAIVQSTRVLPRMKKIVLETRLEFITTDRLRQVADASGKRLDVLTGFETLDPTLRDGVLGKREPLDTVLAGLDIVAGVDADLTAYVLYKPSYEMSDDEAYAEAERSMTFLVDECARRRIPLIIRLNPMYVARDTTWASAAEAHGGFSPPRLTDVMTLAGKMRANGVRVYLGLTSEGLADGKTGTYRAREDFSSAILKDAIVSNYG